MLLCIFPILLTIFLLTYISIESLLYSGLLSFIMCKDVLNKYSITNVTNLCVLKVIHKDKKSLQYSVSRCADLVKSWQTFTRKKLLQNIGWGWIYVQNTGSICVGLLHQILEKCFKVCGYSKYESYNKTADNVVNQRSSTDLKEVFALLQLCSALSLVDKNPLTSLTQSHFTI